MTRVITDLRTLRRAAGISASELSAHAAVGRSRLSMFERGLAEPTGPEADRIAKVLGVGIDAVSPRREA